MPANRSKTISNIIGMQGMLYRTLGSTGEKVSAIGIGGWHNGLNEVVGTQWELRPVLARTDEWFHRRSPTERTHVGHFNARRGSSRPSGLPVPCRGAMGIAGGAGAYRPAPQPVRCLRARTRRRTFSPG
jgi:hypothetical protein